ncbi:myrosinase 1-like [Ostrinia furnacalis]|uniref:myrosinase 1-like n=1 Tax=Ostrinia furnacalis TaxID=93504 RepID=UPI001038F70C|nr:myrosinase 1-like [Ostrinia furnacalis]
MTTPKEVVFCLLLALVGATKRTFPPDFKFGVGTSAYQIEGAWNVSDKTESIWDRLTHSNPGAIVDRSHGDVACDSYHQWQRDIDMAVELGVHFYRFSISWPRILPTGFPNKISKDGKNYYNNLINGLLAKGIEPVVTIYHWDLPQRLQDLGGWTNPLIVDWLGDYAKVLYSLYADRVKTWVTINEPTLICDMAYAGIGFAPMIVDFDIARFLCTKNVLMAHAKAWRIYDEEFRPNYNGKISLSNHVIWYEPMEGETEETADLARAMGEGRYSHPIYSKEGGWPPILEQKMAEASRKEGYWTSRLPALTTEEIEFMRGTFDYYGLNHYTSLLVRRQRPDDVLHFMSGSEEMGVVLEYSPKWGNTSSEWLKSNPEGLRKLLVYIRDTYGDIPIIITENGCASSHSLEDYNRVDYHEKYMEQMLLAINEDKVNVLAYTAWSLMDNFEWNDGYNSRFGLYEVDFEDPLRPRTPRRSAQFYADVIKSNSLDVAQKYRNDEL